MALGQFNLDAALAAPFVGRPGCARSSAGWDVAAANNVQRTAVNAAGTSPVNFLIAVDANNNTQLNNPNATITTGTDIASGIAVDIASVQTVSTNGNGTLTTANLLNQLLLRTTAAAPFNDQVPTAAALVAAVAGLQASGINNLAIYWNYRNGATATATLTTNTGITLSGTMSVTANNVRSFLIVFTNVAAGSEAATIYSLGSSAF